MSLFYVSIYYWELLLRKFRMMSKKSTRWRTGKRERGEQKSVRLFGDVARIGQYMQVYNSMSERADAHLQFLVHVNIYTYTYIYEQAWMNMHTCTHIRAYSHTWIFIHRYLCLLICMYTCVPACAETEIRRKETDEIRIRIIGINLYC